MCIIQFGRFRRTSEQFRVQQPIWGMALNRIDHIVRARKIVRARFPRPYGYIVVYELPDSSGRKPLLLL